MESPGLDEIDLDEIDLDDINIDDIDSEDIAVEDSDPSAGMKKGRGGADALIAQYLLFLHREEIETFVTADYTHANILVRHHVSSTYEIDKFIRQVKRDLTQMLPGYLNFDITGREILISEASDSIASGQEMGISLMLIVIFIIMSFLFVNVRAGLISLVPNLFPVIINFGIMGLLKIPLDTGTCMVAVIAIGIAVDDTIHLMSRYNKETRELGDEKAAIAACIAAELKPVLSTSVSLAMGFIILTTSDMVPLQRLGFLSASVMFYALVGDLIITPILLSSTRVITLWDLLSLNLQQDLLEAKLFQGLRMWQLKKMLLLGDIHEARNGELMIRKGDKGKNVYVILNGGASVFVNRPGGEEFELGKMKRGDLFGELALVSSGIRTANVASEGQTTYFKFEWSGLQRINKIYPYIASKLYLNLTHIIGRRFIEKDNQLIVEKRWIAR